MKEIVLKDQLLLFRDRLQFCITGNLPTSRRFAFSTDYWHPYQSPALSAKAQDNASCEGTTAHLLPVLSRWNLIWECWHCKYSHPVPL